MRLQTHSRKKETKRKKIKRIIGSTDLLRHINIYVIDTEIHNQMKITIDNTMDSDKNNTNSKRDAKKRCVQYMYTS